MNAVDGRENLSGVGELCQNSRPWPVLASATQKEKCVAANESRAPISPLVWGRLLLLPLVGSLGFVFCWQGTFAFFALAAAALGIRCLLPKRRARPANEGNAFAVGRPGRAGVVIHAQGAK